MILIDKIACTGPLKNIHPLEKIVFTVLNIALALIFNTVPVYSVIIVSVFILLSVKARVRLRHYLKFMTVPMAFIIPGLAAIFITVGRQTDGFIVSVPFFSSYLGITKSNLDTCALYMLKSVSLISSFYFLILTTDLSSIMSQLRKIRVPGFLVELAELVYRFIFVLLGRSEAIYVSQSARLGHEGMVRSLGSMGMLLSSLYVNTLKRVDDIENSLQARCYNGDILVIERRISSSPRNYLYISVYGIIITAFGFLSKGFICV